MTKEYPTSGDVIRGVKVTGKNDNALFIALSGGNDIFWTSSLDTADVEKAYCVKLDSVAIQHIATAIRYSAGAVRAVYNPSYEIPLPQGNKNIHNGHEFVKICGREWAKTNVGADEPDEYGDYFSWGETSPKDDYRYSTYTKHNEYKDDEHRVLDLADDAAYVNWGEGWRMPAMLEFHIMFTNSTTKWTQSKNGIYGLKVSENRKWIFLPATGYYNGLTLFREGEAGAFWTRQVFFNQNVYSYCGGVDASGGNAMTNMVVREYGLTVRPIRWYPE